MDDEHHTTGTHTYGQGAVIGNVYPYSNSCAERGSEDMMNTELNRKSARKRRKKPLYRKKNTTARGVRHCSGGNYRHDRNTKRSNNVSMAKNVHRGLDYTPLFMFLLSKVGQPWDQVYSEAVSRLDKEDPVFWIVALDKESAKEVVWTGDRSRFSGLYVDSSGLLQLTNPSLQPGDLKPICDCCTHTLNGKRIPKTAKVIWE